MLSQQMHLPKLAAVIECGSGEGIGGNLSCVKVTLEKET